MPLPQERLISLLEYIEQVEKLKRDPPRQIAKDAFSLSRLELKGLPGVEFNLAGGEDEVWMRVQRLTEDPPPEPEASLKSWVALSKAPSTPPRLQPEISVTGKDGSDSRLKLQDFPGIKVSFDRYVAERWQPWSTKEIPRRLTILLYARLFAVRQSLESDFGDNAKELVWGMGIARWKRPPDGQEIDYPLITQASEVVLDTKSFALEIQPRESDPSLEIDCFAALGLPGVPKVEKAWQEHKAAATLGVNPFDASSTEPVLRAAAGLLDPNGKYTAISDGAPVPADPSNDLQVSGDWVIFVRPRTAHVLIQDIERLKKTLGDTEELPEALAAFVTEGSDEVVRRPEIHFRGLSSSRTGAGVRELYFPMPYNDEQVSIVSKLETSDGVVVQGPPGTGKTHTIANVICHFLAHGKKVLVTSKGEEALRVLQEKLPEDIRPLSVALLANDSAGLKQFEHSIQTIASKVSSLQPNKLEEEIRGHEARLEQLHEKIATIDRSISGLAHWQLSRIKLEGEEESPEDLARRVIKHEDQYSWLTDEIDPSKIVPSFTNEDIGQIRQARQRVGKDISYIDCELPAADSLPNSDSLVALHHDIQRSHKILQREKDGVLLTLVDTKTDTFDKAKKLAAVLTQWHEIKQKIDADGFSWSAKVRKLLASSDPADANLKKQLLTLSDEVLAAEASRRSRLSAPVEAPVGAEVDADLLDAIGRCAAGKSPFSLPFGKKDARAALAGITVSGLKPKSQEDWERVKDELAYRISARRLISSWNSMAGEFGFEPVTGNDPGALKSVTHMAEHVRLVNTLAVQVDHIVPQAAREVFGGSASRLPMQDLDKAYGLIRLHLAAQLDKERLSYTLNQVQTLREKLEGKSGAIVEWIHRIITHELGAGDTTDETLALHWQQAQAELRRLAALRTDLATIDRVSASVSEAGSPVWAKRLRSEPADPQSDGLTTPTWLEAWRWRAAKTFLDRLEGHEELKDRVRRRKSAEEDLAKTYQQLVAARTWLSLHARTTDNVKQALAEYLNAIFKIGTSKGGKRAAQHRVFARAAMERAQPAVPCWIMPEWKVSETIPAKIGSFDLVILDEASQSDIWAMPALLRGQKVLIVGDHKQVSPVVVGIEHEKFQGLYDRFLKEMPHGSQMLPMQSVYDLGTVVFAGNSVMLKEHFRCVSAIIEFSNREYYQGEIKPLRIPKKSERLDPPLIDVFVKGGFRKSGHDVNMPEAKAIIAEIEAIIADPLMKGRTIGVCTLLGHDQAKKIDEMVRAQIPTHEIVTRRIRVGDPTYFQGRESDIMLLSMVLAGTDRGLQNTLMFQQRFNVAASRARDRMMLFRSIDESRINAESPTAKLIAHFRKPFQQDPKKVGSLRELCESDFERDMYDELVKRGFRVQPQVKVGGYRIDMVVEGAEDRRLAVECDGDRYHGPDRWDADMSRQRVLERAGWTFWRCFASSFVARRNQVLDDLLGTLRTMGIDPLGSEVLEDLSAWVSTRVVEPEPEEDA